MSLLVNRQPKAKVVRPVHGVAKWLSPPGFLGAGVLTINGTLYHVMRLDGGVGYRLEKTDGTIYDVNTEAAAWTCDCKDAIYNSDRPGGCKHAVALRAALAALGQQ